MSLFYHHAAAVRPSCQDIASLDLQVILKSLTWPWQVKIISALTVALPMYGEGRLTQMLYIQENRNKASRPHTH